MSLDAAIAAALAGRCIKALVIGGSADGVDALLTLLPLLPAGFALPVLCILHLPPDRTSRLAELFGQRIALPALEAADKMPIAPGTVYFAGAGYHLSVERDLSFSLSCEAPLHFARPAIDVLMQSAADAWGAGLAGVLLTGANQDGAEGMAQIRNHGGLTIVQDPQEAQSPAMPLAAIARGAAQLVLPLAQIGALLPMLEKS